MVKAKVKYKNGIHISKTIGEVTTADKQKIKQFIIEKLDFIDDARDKGIYIGLVNVIKKDIIKLGIKALPVLDELLNKKAYSETTEEYIEQIITIIKNKARKDTPKEFANEVQQLGKKSKNINYNKF